MTDETKSVQMEQAWLEAEMLERVTALRAVDQADDPITYARRERSLNEAIDEYSDLLRMIGRGSLFLMPPASETPPPAT